MPSICPRPCSRLATAAVFISVGVVQFIVGIILLRSKYVYLLAGPDFWTSSCNITVGCLLGTSASVWKRSRKRQSKKHVLRRNLLLSLMFSALTLNATTLGIFLLGEGNTLLSIRLESNGDSTFKREVLAYAYVTSVCCPIVCIVVSIVSISGTCFKYATMKNSKGMKTPQNSIEKGNSRALRWIYTPELVELSKRKIRDFLSSSAESSSEDDLDTPIHQKHTDSAKDVQCVLSRMAQGKRDSILSDSTIMLRQLDLRRKNRCSSLNRDGSYIIPGISRSRESGLNDSSLLYNDTSRRNKNPKRDHTDVIRNSRIPLDVMLKRANYSKSKQVGPPFKNPYTSEELLNEYQSSASHLSKPSQYRKFRESLQAKSEVDGTAFSCTSDVPDYESQSTSAAHTMVEMSESEPPSMTRSAEYISQKPNFESSSSKRHSRVAIEESEHRRYDALKETSSRLNDCLSPDDSEFEDVMFEMSRGSSWAGDIIPIKIKHSSAAKLSDKLIPVANPVVPVDFRKQEVSKISDDSGIGTTESNSFTESSSQSDFKDRKSNLSSFRDDLKYGIMENKVGPQSAKKYDLNRVLKMASITEEPSSELNRPEVKSNDAVNKVPKGHSRSKSLHIRSEMSKGDDQDEADSRRSTTPKRKNVTGRSLKKIWSVAMSENQTSDFMDQVVDADSLIGLSEEELIARQLRTRSIRKAIQQRIKEQISV